MTTRMVRASAIVSVLAITILTAPGLNGQEASSVERFTAIAIDAASFSAPRTGMLEIVVTRWSRDDERDLLLGVLIEQGPEVMLDELGETPRAGYIRTPVGRSYDIHLARQIAAGDGSRDVTLVTDRPVGFWQAFSPMRSVDFPFTVIQLHLNPAGQGDGAMLLAARITSDREPGTIEVEQYVLQPIRLMNVRSAKEPPRLRR